MDAIKDLLSRIAANDELSLRALLAPAAPSSQAGSGTACALDRRTRALVQLAALLASDAGTTSLRWAVDRASATGADEATLVGVLLATGSVAGNAQMVAGACRLALAIDLDLGAEGSDGS